MLRLSVSLHIYPVEFSPYMNCGSLIFLLFVKAACGLSHKPKVQIVDIDATDVNNELAVLEYVEDIYTFYKIAEVGYLLHILLFLVHKS